MTPEHKLLTDSELSAIRDHWSRESDKGSWGKDDVAKLLGHVEALEQQLLKELEQVECSCKGSSTNPATGEIHWGGWFVYKECTRCKRIKELRQAIDAAKSKGEK